MIQTFKAIIDANGVVRLLERVRLSRTRRALVTVLDDDADLTTAETAMLSEPALGKDWNRPEEDEAWSHLQSDLSS